MSLTSEQKKELKELGKKFSEFEKAAINNNIDLDVFMTGYGDDGIEIYATEIVSQKAKAGKRKGILENYSGEQKKPVTKHA